MARIMMLATLAAGLCGMVIAQDAPAQPAGVTLSGTVACTTDEAGTLTGVCLEVECSACEGDCECPPETYHVTLDDVGCKLAGCDGHAVSATGTVSERDGQKWLTVTDATCEICEEPDQR
ncbi:MAG: hypothetical protein HY608_03715 [Planctomycetes bacterium]|nr:hypothetical protein [Planctomycetota bacterium]